MTTKTQFIVKASTNYNSGLSCRYALINNMTKEIATKWLSNSRTLEWLGKETSDFEMAVFRIGLDVLWLKDDNEKILSNLKYYGDFLCVDGYEPAEYCLVDTDLTEARIQIEPNGNAVIVAYCEHDGTEFNTEAFSLENLMECYRNMNA